MIVIQDDSTRYNSNTYLVPYNTLARSLSLEGLRAPLDRYSIARSCVANAISKCYETKWQANVIRTALH